MLKCSDYTDEVFKYLEYLGYPELVIGYDENDVSRAMGHSIAIHYELGISPRKSAVIIWSLTMNFQIMRKNQVTH